MKRTILEVWITLTADKRKAAILGAMLIVLVGFSARSILKSGPSPARASSSNSASSRPGANATDAVSRTLAAIDEQRKGPYINIPHAETPSRNLFALSSTHFPEPAQPEQPDKGVTPAVTPPVKIVDGGPRNQPPSTEQRVRQEAADLRLRSTLVGATPLAVIEYGGGRNSNRVVLSPGHTVLGFILIEVRSHAVLIEKEGVRVELRRPLPED